MSNKKIYMDFQNGDGFVDVSKFVVYTLHNSLWF